MDNRSGIARQAQALVEETLAGMGLDLVDVEYVREGGAWYLRFYIDKRGGVTLDDCADASRAMDPMLDEGLDIPGSYNLEVSSPGLARPLRKPADFARHMGEPVEVALYRARDGSKKHEGILTGYAEDGTLTIRTADGTEQVFKKEETARVKRAVWF